MDVLLIFLFLLPIVLLQHLIQGMELTTSRKREFRKRMRH